MTKVKKSTIYFPDRAPVRVLTEVELKASPDEVWNVLIDCSSWTQWFEGVKSCEMTSSTPSGVGGTRKININGTEFEEEIIAYEPRKLWAFTVYGMKPIHIAKILVERVVFEDIQNEKGELVGTRLKYAAGIEPTWLSWILKPLVVRNMSGAWRRSLQNIDAYLESKKSNNS